jgi:predicted RND superfamily exporter protein
MLDKLGSFIEKKPWFVIIAVILITIGFSTALPSLEFKTDFNEFFPEDELSNAYEEIQDKFGMSQVPMFALVEKQQTRSTITPQAIREIYYIEKELKKIPKVYGVISLTTFLEPVCLIEFGKTIENCTDEQIQTALDDLLLDAETGELKIFENDDENEPIDYKRYPRFSQGKSIDSADIKNCYISKDNESITFTIEVYDLSEFEI